VVPGSGAPLPADATAGRVAAAADAIGFPLLVKAVGGGGGKGMRTVTDPGDLVAAVRAARSEAAASFGDSRVYFERLLVRPRHVEVQLLGDEHGALVAFVERECSLQRRHQKVLEESPSPAVTPALRAAIAQAALAVARHVGYTNAGTIEFLLDRDERFYFLEMNTRLQVEHPVTEAVTGIDLVHWQIRVARGERLELAQDALLDPRGHAIECRIYAEDPDNRFLPAPGRITALRAASGPGIRDDSGVEAGSEVPIFYDPLISKLIAWGHDRPTAVSRLRRALDEYEVGGIATTIPFFRWLLGTDDFRAARFDTTSLDRTLAARGGRSFVEVLPESLELAAIGAALHEFLSGGGGVPPPARAGQPAGGWKGAARRESLRG
jgi:acetyl-CoA carboxylase biotin carboxylase subunit